LKTKDNFIEKFGQGTDDEDINHDNIRAEIGRTLDRIRSAEGAGRVFRGDERPGTAGPTASV
jgi:hypothetical protein